MTAKSFCYACLGIFLLVAAWTMGAQHAKADFDPGVGPVIAIDNLDNSVQVLRALRSDGTVWRVGNGTPWRLDTDLSSPLPVSISEIAFWNYDKVVTRNGDAWLHFGAQWNNFGPIPPATVSVEPSTMSDVKGKFRDEEDN